MSTRYNRPMPPRKARRGFVSFFSGALGLDLGLEAAGLVPLAVNEFDPVACQTIRKNKPRLKLYSCDIRTLTAERLLDDLGLEREELFAVAGGPPCQAFSTAGRRLGLNDERGNVFLHFIELIAGLRPKYAIFENVRGLLSAPLVHRPHDQRGRDFPALRPEELPGGALLHVLNLLERHGYTTTFTLYNTANYGVPQIRERLIFFASREGKRVPYLPPSHDEHEEGGLLPWKSFREAVESISQESNEYVTFPQKRMKYFKKLKAGQNWRDLPVGLQRAAMGASFHAGGGKTGFYRRLAWATGPHRRWSQVLRCRRPPSAIPKNYALFPWQSMRPCKRFPGTIFSRAVPWTNTGRSGMRSSSVWQGDWPTLASV